MNLHAPLIGPFSAFRGPLAMCLDVFESAVIDFIDIVDNKWIFYLDTGTLVDGCWQKFKIHENAWYKKNGFPCRNWPTQVGHSQQYMSSVWFKHILHISNGYSYRVLIFIRCFVDKNIQISWIDMRLQSDRPKTVNLHVFSIRPFRVITGPLAMSLGVSESWDIEFIDIVDNKYNFFLKNTWWTVVYKFKICENTW